jgi:hypothetical protein
MPGFAFPQMGPLGLGSPPSSVLCSAKTACCPSQGPSLLARPPIPCLLPRFCVSRKSAGLAVRQKQPHQRQGSWSAGTPTPPAISARRQQALPSSRVAPVSTCPALRPRWCPNDIAITPPGLLPSGINKPSAFPLQLPKEVIPMTTNALFRGSITRPALSLHPASHIPLLESHADFTTDLLAGLWPGGTRYHIRTSPTGQH